MEGWELRGVMADNDHSLIIFIFFHETKAVSRRHGLLFSAIVCEAKRVGA